MKYAIIIPDGCADDPQQVFEGKTPLQAADIPFMDRIARMGVVGLSNNVPESLIPASDVATLSLFGYDPLKVYTGRAPLETAAMGIELGPDDWAIRCNLVTIEDDHMRDFTAGHISSEEGKELIELLQEKLGGPIEHEGKKGVLEFHPGVSYRNILVFRGEGETPFSTETTTQAPHDVPDQPIAPHMPKGPGSRLLIDLMKKSHELFAEAEPNNKRRERGESPASQVWLWGQGSAPQLESFQTVYDKVGAIISGVDLVRGVGALIGWKRIDVPGATGYLDTDYVAKGKYAVDALPNYDLVCVHVEAPDEASHEGLPDAKVAALEEIDRHIVGPLLTALSQYPEWRILVSPDHRTTLSTRAHAHGAVPFTACGTEIVTKGQVSYDEVVAKASGMLFERGHELMRWFLGSGEEES
ncbi:MAG: cofactor-independent phosphoglycerate mutase [Gemmataceae bacterium]